MITVTAGRLTLTCRATVTPSMLNSTVLSESPAGKTEMPKRCELLSWVKVAAVTLVVVFDEPTRVMHWTVVPPSALTN